jgi:hypothetical protein
VIAPKENKIKTLHIAWQQETGALKMLPPVNRKLKSKKIIKKQANKEKLSRPAFEKWKMPEQPVGYIKAPRYEFF